MLYARRNVFALGAAIFFGFLTTSPTAAAPTFAGAVTNGTVNISGLSEASGVAASRNNANVLWTHNDSGHAAVVFALDTLGRWLGTYTLPGNTDNEDIAIGPGPVTNVSYLYVGDIGDNSANRSNIWIYQIPEPAVYARQYTNPVTTGMKGARRITLTYPDGARDAEAMFVDSVSGDLFILSKESTSRIYTAPKSQLDTNDSFVLTFVRTLSFNVPDAADISPSGNEIIVRQENFARLWTRANGQTISNAFGGTAITIPVAGTANGEPNGEAIGFDSIGSGYFTLSDNATNQPLRYFARTSGDGPRAPQTLVPAGSVWKYLDNGSNQGMAWRAPGFNDSSWSNGAAQFGYGDGDEQTVVSFGGNANNKYVTTYFRKNFVAGNVADITNLTLKLVMDDGAAVSLNGTPVVYEHLSTNAAYNTPATAMPVALQSTWQTHDIDPGLLQEGTNGLAVEIHQSSVTGSNLSFDLQLLATRAGQILAYEPFNYPAETGLVLATNAAGQWWSQAGPDSANQPTNHAGNLSVTGLADSIGNSVQFGGDGTSARFNLNTVNAADGSWFFSFIVRLADITGLSPSGIFWAGFNNSTGTQTGTPTSVGTRVYTRAASDGFNVGLSKNSSNSGERVWNPQVFDTNQILFVIGSYTFNAGSGTDDVAQLWINPAPETFGAAAPPLATLTNTAGTDLSQLASFVLFNRSTAEPALILVDELRVGTTWASVTPAGVIPPILNVARVGGDVVLSWPTNASVFVLEATATLGATTVWINDSSPVHVVNDQFTVTNSAPVGTRFYRLRKSP